MKLLYCAKSVALITLAVLAFGCKQNDPQVEVSEEKGHFKITFTNAKTKAFFDDNAKGEECERKLHNAAILIYKTGENAITHCHHFSAYELGLVVGGVNKPTAVISLPTDKFDVTQTYDFYVLANHDQETSALDAIERSALIAIAYKDLALYNNADFAPFFVDGQMVAQRKKAANVIGFAMSGQQMGVTPTGNDNTPRAVSISVSRNVAKVEARAWTTEAFYTNYNTPYKSKLTVKSVALHNVAGSTLAIIPSTFTASTETPIDLTQTPLVIDDRTSEVESADAPSTNNPDKKAYHNLFYLFENELVGATPDEANKVKLVVSADFDFDGNDATADDVSKIKYETTVKGTANGLIARNSHYQLNIRISGLTNQEIVASFTVNDWATVVSEDINFGN